MTDQAIEHEIQAKGLTAPRVTPADIAANIASEHYFSASDGVLGALYAASEDGDIGNAGAPVALSMLTICVLTLQNGFTVTGESACASQENFDAEIGRKIARDNAFNKIWPLMGYALKQKLHDQSRSELKPSDSAANLPPHQQRVITEREELATKTAALQKFFDTDIFAGLPMGERDRMQRQVVWMEAYRDVLDERIAAF